MLIRTANKFLGPLGYELRKPKTVYGRRLPEPAAGSGKDFALYSYLNADGTFDYARYRQIQEDGNKHKIDGVWVIEDNIAFLARYIQRRLGDVSFGICHGTRRGKEQEWFRKHLGDANIIGTEISETATQFPNTIQWDFHDVKPEWLGKTDFIYSNSFDHSYDPKKCMDAWMSCLRPGGLCILEHSDEHSPESVTEMDPFGARLTLMPYLVTLWGEGRYGVREILDAPAKRLALDYVAFIVIQKFDDEPRS